MLIDLVKERLLPHSFTALLINKALLDVMRPFLHNSLHPFNFKPQ